MAVEKLSLSTDSLALRRLGPREWEEDPGKFPSLAIVHKQKQKLIILSLLIDNGGD